MNVTIYDVAKKAGVSIATVSRVINNSDLVSERTSDKVKAVIEELHYSPNVIAYALTKKSTLTLGLLIPDIANPFYSELSRGVEDAANDYGFNVIMCNTDYSVDKEAVYITLLKQKIIDGFIISSTHHSDKNIVELLEEDRPLVLVDRDIDVSGNYSIDMVGSDNIRGGYIAAKHLIDLGHRDIACLLGPPEIKVNRDREKGFRRAMEEAGLKVCADFLRYGDLRIDFGYKVAQEMLKGQRKPTAFFTANDLTALGVIRGIKHCGLSVPDDVSVVGYDNTVLAEMVDPLLTTVNQQMRKMGYMATELLIKRIRGEREPGVKILLSTDLVSRVSTRAPKPRD